MTIGAIYKAWGQRALEEATLSARSAKTFGLQTMIIVEADFNGNFSDPCFDHIKHMAIDAKRGILEKPKGLLEFCPWNQCVFLDTDTTVCGRLDFGFEMAAKHGIALTIAPFYSLANTKQWKGAGDWIQYNTGVIFFDKAKGRSALQAWELFCAIEDLEQCDNDQPALTRAFMHTETNPFVLPANWNFRDKWQYLHGELKIWHNRRALPERLRYQRPQRGSRE